MSTMHHAVLNGNLSERTLCSAFYSDTDMSLRYGSITHRIIMAALCNRAGHYIFALWLVVVFIMIIIMSIVFGKRTVSRTSVDATLRRRMDDRHHADVERRTTSRIRMSP